MLHCRYGQPLGAAKHKVSRQVAVLGVTEQEAPTGAFLSFCEHCSPECDCHDSRRSLYPNSSPTDAPSDVQIGIVKLALKPLHFQTPCPIAVLWMNAIVCTRHNTIPSTHFFERTHILIYCYHACVVVLSYFKRWNAPTCSTTSTPLHVWSQHLDALRPNEHSGRSASSPACFLKPWPSTKRRRPKRLQKFTRIEFKILRASSRLSDS